MSPADELHAAAKKIRDTAKGATPGPWQVGNGTEIGIGIEQHSRGRFSYDALLAEVTSESDRINDVEDAKAIRGVDITVGMAEDDAAWIALASPALAEPLAAWLEGITRRHNLSPDSDYPDRCIWCLEPGPCPDLRDALTVARAINGQHPTNQQETNR